MPLVAVSGVSLMSMDNLAATYNDQGKWTKAEEMEVLVMETSKRVLGPEHPDTLMSVNNLASMYHNQGRWTGGRDGGTSDGDEKKGVRAGASFHAD